MITLIFKDKCHLCSLTVFYMRNHFRLSLQAEIKLVESSRNLIQARARRIMRVYHFLVQYTNAELDVLCTTVFLAY